MNRRFVAASLLFVGAATLVAGSALAQRPASAKVRGDAYYFYAGEVYRGHAADHAFMLNEYASTGEPVPKEVVQEHAAAVRSNIEASRRAYQKVSAAAKKDPAAAAKLKEIEKAHASALALCDKLDAESAKSAGEAAKIGAACGGIMEQLDGADEVHKKLAAQLKIATLDQEGGK
ncbi:MAG TPA: hypothetical protein VMF30_12205 [Pirellulales bacterium]|nr:hypothetical protein [Pirellulales bacterium]